MNQMENYRLLKKIKKTLENHSCFTDLVTAETLATAIESQTTCKQI